MKTVESKRAIQISVKEAQGKFQEVIAQVSRGEEVILMDGVTPVARIVPVSSRIPGLHEGAIWTSPDFDEPLPDAFWVGES